MAGALLENSQKLIRIGLKPTEIIEGYELAAKKILEDFLPKVVVDKVNDIKTSPLVRSAIRTSLMSKQYGREDFITDLVLKACLSVFDTYLNVDNIRVCKILGSGIESSQVINGMVFKKLVSLKCIFRIYFFKKIFLPILG